MVIVTKAPCRDTHLTTWILLRFWNSGFECAIFAFFLKEKYLSKLWATLAQETEILRNARTSWTLSQSVCSTGIYSWTRWDVIFSEVVVCWLSYVCHRNFGLPHLPSIIWGDNPKHWGQIQQHVEASSLFELWDQLFLQRFSVKNACLCFSCYKLN